MLGRRGRRWKNVGETREAHDGDDDEVGSGEGRSKNFGENWQKCRPRTRCWGHCKGSDVEKEVDDEERSKTMQEAFIIEQLELGKIMVDVEITIVIVVLVICNIESDKGRIRRKRQREKTERSTSE